MHLPLAFSLALALEQRIYSLTPALRLGPAVAVEAARPLMVFVPLQHHDCGPRNRPITGQ